VSRVTIELTREQALAIWRCAGCAADTYDDALTVLGDPSRVQALNRGMAALESAIFRPKRKRAA
jgi:hypothetical protein